MRLVREQSNAATNDAAVAWLMASLELGILGPQELELTHKLLIGLYYSRLINRCSFWQRSQWRLWQAWLCIRQPTQNQIIMPL